MAPPDRPTSADMVSMRDYVDTRLTALQLAVDKAQAAQQIREHNQNEWRSAMTDRERTFLTREVFEASISNAARCHDDIKARLSDLENKQSHAEGRSWMMYTALGVGLTVLNIALSIALRILFP